MVISLLTTWSIIGLIVFTFIILLHSDEKSSTPYLYVILSGPGVWLLMLLVVVTLIIVASSVEYISKQYNKLFKS